MKTLLPCIFFLVLCTAQAQSVKVKKENVRVKGENAEGYAVELNGASTDVEDELNKYIKPLGKSKKSDNIIIISLPSVNGKAYTSPLYATVKADGSTWIGLLASEWPSEPAGLKNDIEKLVYEFGVTYKREVVQRQINESVQASQAVEKQQQKLAAQNKDYNNKIDNNRLEKARLEKALEENKLELESLMKKIEQNKKDQDSLVVVSEQVKKMMEIQKDRQRKIN